MAAITVCREGPAALAVLGAWRAYYVRRVLSIATVAYQREGYK